MEGAAADKGGLEILVDNEGSNKVAMVHDDPVCSEERTLEQSLYYRWRC